MNDKMFEFKPSLGWDESKKETTVGFKIWDNQIGKEVFNLVLPNPPEKLKSIDFFDSKEWVRIKPEVEKGCYHLFSLLMR